jgi:hypothetical protein
MDPRNAIFWKSIKQNANREIGVPGLSFTPHGFA